MRGRLAALLGPEQTPRWVGTFHAVMARLLIEDGASVPGCRAALPSSARATPGRC